MEGWAVDPKTLKPIHKQLIAPMAMDFGFRTLRGAADVNGKHFLTNSHSTDSRAPTNADPAERASNEKLHFRLHEKYPKARKSAIFLKCAKLHQNAGERI